MRVVFVLFALAGTVLASPSLRWLDETGGFHAAAVKRLLEETATSLKVELAAASDAADAKPQVFTIPMIRVLEFVREDTKDEEQKRLLEARTAVAAGVELKEACVTLDRLSAKAREPWVREYAAAFRAIAANRRGEEDALKRITAFLRAYPKSRFVCDAIRARAWTESLAITNVRKLMAPFADAFHEIGERGGSYVTLYGCIRDAALRNTRIRAAELRSLGRSLDALVNTIRPDATAAELVVRLGLATECEILVAGVKWREAVSADIPTALFRDDLAQLENSVDLLLPDTIVELRLEQAALAVAEKRLDAAERYLGLAAKQSSSQAHQFLRKRARDQLSALRDKR